MPGQINPSQAELEATGKPYLMDPSWQRKNQNIMELRKNQNIMELPRKRKSFEDQLNDQMNQFDTPPPYKKLPFVPGPASDELPYKKLPFVPGTQGNEKGFMQNLPYRPGSDPMEDLRSLKAQPVMPTTTDMLKKLLLD